MSLINWSLVKNPLNWAIILLMLIIAGVGGHLVMSYAGQHPATGENKNS